MNASFLIYNTGLLKCRGPPGSHRREHFVNNEAFAMLIDFLQALLVILPYLEKSLGVIWEILGRLAGTLFLCEAGARGAVPKDLFFLAGSRSRV